MLFSKFDHVTSHHRELNRFPVSHMHGAIVFLCSVLRMLYYYIYYEELDPPIIL